MKRRSRSCLKRYSTRRLAAVKRNWTLPDDIKAKVTALSASQRRREDVSAILASLRCTPEMIAEQQAALDASE